MAAIADLLQEIANDFTAAYRPGYREKMLHPVPMAPSVDREAFILQRCAGKVVLNLGTADPLHSAIAQVAKETRGADKVLRHDCADFILMDFDLVSPGVKEVPLMAGTEILVCGEVLEHLGNPLNFLRSLRRYTCPLLVTVPNAFARINARALPGKMENVNVDHVAWYSPRTLRTLLERASWKIKEFAWYGGDPGVAEGLIAVAE